MSLATDPSEVWVQLHYRFKGEAYKFNLPLPRGGKFLDGLRLDFDVHDVPSGRRITISMESLGPVEIDSFVLTGHLDYEDIKGVFVNGYQSWTGSRERSPGERISSLDWPGRFLSLHRLGDAGFYSYSERKGRFHGYGYAYIRYPDRIFLAGSLNEDSGYTIVGTDVRHSLMTISKDLQGFRLDGREEILDFVLLEGSESEVFDQYSRLKLNSYTRAPLNFAWMSEAKGKRRLDELVIRRNLGALRDNGIPLDYFVIGDGWQSALGEWKLLAPGFPSGMASLGVEIRGSGYRPGIWFAPFVVGIDSAIFRTRKDWLARESGKAPRPAGRLARHGGVFFALDLSRTDVREYIAESYRRVRDEWGYKLIYMDLLYAAGLYPRNGLSRGGAMADAMAFLFSLKGDDVWVCNGVPLDAVFGSAEYSRISADTTPYWENLYRRNIHARERASTLNALRSTVGRRQLNGRFFANAVDNFYLSSAKGVMEAPRRYTQLLLHLLFATFVTTSDDIAEYDIHEMKTFCSIFPLVEPDIESVHEFRRTVTVIYRAAGRRYMSVSNLAERVRSFQLPEGPWFGSPGLRRRAHHVGGGRRHHLKPGESRNYLCLDDNDPFAGSDGHIFPGAEIAEIRGEGTDWTVVPVDPDRRSFQVWLKVPGDCTKATINGRSAEIQRTLSGQCLATGIVEGDSSEGGLADPVKV